MKQISLTLITIFILLSIMSCKETEDQNALDMAKQTSVLTDNSKSIRVVYADKDLPACMSYLDGSLFFVKGEKSLA